ncbi:MAG: NAD(P)H-hydrate dehydratase [Actinomycetota bacterium]|nr:NAD(P)H-hydrate dehydratase [Actinomycetota bacterium]
MIPVLTPEEMAAVDRQADDPVEILIDRAGAAVSRAALGLLGGAYGRRVVVVAGSGNNGADGRAAAAHLRRRGVRVTVVAAGDEQVLADADLVIDAAYGTGLRRPYRRPDTGAAPVLAVDIPSGVSGLSGEVLGAGEAPDPQVLGVWATATVTFAAYKPGLLLGEGAGRVGEITVVDIGLGALVEAAARAWLVRDDDVDRLLPHRPREAHKWQSALQLVAGSPGMTGAPWMVATAAMRTGAGYVRLGLPGVDPGTAGLPPSEVVSSSLPATGWVDGLGDGLARCRALVVGPGLGRLAIQKGSTSEVVSLARAASCPVLIDADGIGALGGVDGLRDLASSRSDPTVITPHAGEYQHLTGEAPPPDRLEAVRALAQHTGAVVLLKGSTTVVGDPDGRVLLAASGSSRLATAGTGDVLSGVIGALMARGVPAWEAAGLGAHIHGRASALGRSQGLVALDLPDLISSWLSTRRP